MIPCAPNLQAKELESLRFLSVSDKLGREVDLLGVVDPALVVPLRRRRRHQGCCRGQD